jgi:hypothetical protein
VEAAVVEAIADGEEEEDSVADLEAEATEVLAQVDQTTFHWAEAIEACCCGY